MLKERLSPLSRGKAGRFGIVLTKFSTRTEEEGGNPKPLVSFLCSACRLFLKTSVLPPHYGRR